jgi:hypothetical protein
MSPHVLGFAVSLPPEGCIAPLELSCESKHA